MNFPLFGVFTLDAKIIQDPPKEGVDDLGGATGPSGLPRTH